MLLGRKAATRLVGRWMPIRNRAAIEMGEESTEREPRLGQASGQESWQRCERERSSAPARGQPEGQCCSP